MQKYIVNTNNSLNAKSISFNLGIGEDFALNLHQNDVFNQSYIEKIKEENINPIIDYEKQIFSCTYIQNVPGHNTILKQDNIDKNTCILKIPDNTEPDGLLNVDKYTDEVNDIVFNVYLRERNKNEEGEIIDFTPIEGSYWNLNNKLKLYGYGDLLGDIGFSDDEVYYQKNVIKKTFLRISIYDTPYRQTQKLLYYSTLFLDSNKLYDKYNWLSVNTNAESKTDYYPASNEIGAGRLLTCSFTATPKNNSDASSDGFYLYLFENITQKQTLENSPMLYMKIELNHAKYGKTIPLIWPHQKGEKTNDEIDFNNQGNFPKTYEVEYGDNGNSYVDMNALYDDLYIPITVRYNQNKHKYEWVIISKECRTMSSLNEMGKRKDRIFINLFEPIINNLKTSENG